MAGFRIGIEVEALLIPQDQKALPLGLDLDRFAEAVAHNHNSKIDGNGNHSMRVDIGRTEQGEGFKDWVLTDDVTLKGDQNAMYMIEIVSPILMATPCEDLGKWRHEISDMFKHLSDLCQIRSNRSCGFHIHLSPVGADWTLVELKGIAVAIIHFEQAFEAMIPETRRGNQFIRSNRFFGNEQLKGLKHSECITKIQSQESVESLAELMSSDRYTTWNFENLKEDSRNGTLEFRQPPGQTRAAGCLSWIELAINFVQSGRRKDWFSNVRAYPQTVAGLKAFVTEGFVKGLSRPSHLDPLMHSQNAGLSVVPTAPAYDTTLMTQKEKEDKKKNILMEKLKESLEEELRSREDH